MTDNISKTVEQGVTGRSAQAPAPSLPTSAPDSLPGSEVGTGNPVGPREGVTVREWVQKFAATFGITNDEIRQVWEGLVRDPYHFDITDVDV